MKHHEILWAVILGVVAGFVAAENLGVTSWPVFSTVYNAGNSAGGGAGSGS